LSTPIGLAVPAPSYVGKMVLGQLVLLQVTLVSAGVMLMLLALAAGESIARLGKSFIRVHLSSSFL